MTFWRWLVHGSDEMVMPKAWLANRDRLRAYDHYTRRQRFQGSITAGVEEMRRREFWEEVAAKVKQARAVGNVAQFRQSSR